MLRRALIVIFLIEMVSVTGCSALKGRVVPPTVAEDTHGAVGISYYLPKPTLSILQKTLAGGKKATPQYEIAVSYVPDSTQRFEVGMSQGWFTSDTFHLKLTPNHTVSSLNSKRTDELGNTFASLIGLVAAVAPLAKSIFLPLTDANDDLSKVLSDTDKTKFHADETAIRSALEKKQAMDPAVFQSWEKFAKQIEQGLIEGKGPNNGNFLGLTVMTNKVASYYQSGSEKESEPADDKATSYQSLIRRYEAILSEIQGLRSQVTQDQKKLPGQIAQALSDLQKEVLKELVVLVKTPGGDRSKFTSALGNLKTAIRTIIEGRDAFDRKLLERRDLLTAFLAAAPPAVPTRDYGKVYVQFSEELGKVISSISSLVENDTAAPSDPLPLATDVTSRIEDRIFILRLRQPLSETQIYNDMVPIATAIVKYAKYDAVIILREGM